MPQPRARRPSTSRRRRDLAGGVEIGGLDAEVGAKLRDARALLAYDGGHAADGLLARLYHQPAALGDDLEAGREIGRRGGRGRGLSPRLQAMVNFTAGRLPASRKAATTASPVHEAVG